MADVPFAGAPDVLSHFEIMYALFMVQISLPADRSKLRDLAGQALMTKEAMPIDACEIYAEPS